MLIALLLAAAAAPEPVIEIRPSTRPGAYCEVAVLGRVHAYPTRQAAIMAEFRLLKRLGQPVRVQLADPSLPYRCVGAILFLVQRARLTAMGFIGNELVR